MVKYLDDMTDADIMALNIPTGKWKYTKNYIYIVCDTDIMLW
jgi:bisphosphoglycerate-dependent phosphoglycerate mutase